MIILRHSVVDPHWFRIRIQGFDDKKILKFRIEKNLIFFQKQKVHHSKTVDFCTLFSVFCFMYVIQYCFICQPSDSTVSEDAGIEPSTVATLALTTRLDLSHPFLTTWIQPNTASTTIIRCFCPTKYENDMRKLLDVLLIILRNS